MFRKLLKICFGVLLIAFVVISDSAIAQAQSVPQQLAKAVEEIENLDAMRSGLASTLEGAVEAPTRQTMKEVCKPVGMRAQQLSKENGWQVKQMSTKYRNPDHQPDNLHAKMALAKFDKDSELMGFWDQETLNQEGGTRYYRRINIEASCLACHGRKGERPEFIQKGYPQDLAYDFNVGDLRGMYAVFIPEAEQQSVQAALSSATEIGR